MFDVVKSDDIRMVYDGSKSGLNNALRAPWFVLPTIDTMTQWTVAGTWLADNNYGEMFLNFPMHPDLQPYCGIDVTNFSRNSKKKEMTRPLPVGDVVRWE